MREQVIDADIERLDVERFELGDLGRLEIDGHGRTLGRTKSNFACRTSCLAME
jgi:hypothetical protein